MKSEGCASMELNIFKNNSNRALTLDILYHPDETRILDYLHDVLFSITTFLSIFTLYTVYTRSPATMGLYKYVLLNSTIWIYIGEIVLFFWRPVPAFPYLTFYSSGVFKYLSPDYLLWIVFAVLASLLGVENSFGIAFLYRISQVFFTNWFHEFVNDKKHLIAMFIGLYAFELGVLGAPYLLLIWFPYDSNQVLRSISSDAPVYSQISCHEPSLSGCDFRSVNCRIVSIALLVSVLLLHVILGTIAFVLYIFYVRQNLLIKKTVSKKTYALNQQLFRALMMQLAAFGAFLTLPCSIIPCVFILSNLFYADFWNIIVQLAFVLVTLYPFGEAITLLYFVKPYRNFIESLVRQVLEYFHLHRHAALFQKPMNNNNSAFSIANNQLRKLSE